MARFADTRQHRTHNQATLREEVTLERRVTLYGHGINPGHVRLHPGDTATLVTNGTTTTIEYTDEDGTTYSTTTS